jgi:alpha/beta superfamily hydrolase
MTEERMFFQSEGLKIEGLLNESPGEKAVVITHPHPLYGGEMHNNVVESLIAAYHQKGFTTLRFNFRGVGRSEGSHGEGVGEQEDVRAALAYLNELGKSSLDLAGYSFGSWVNAMGLESFDPVKRLVMVSPPVAVIDFSFLNYSPRIQLVISGSEDDIAPPAMINDMLPTWNPGAEFRVIDGVDHFYWGGTNEVEEIIRNFLDKSYE